MMRNALCHKYGDYLTLAAHFRDDFDCSACRYRRSYHCETQDLAGYYLLFLPKRKKRHRA